MELNHICKYSGCKLGDDGAPKHYYACPDCDKHYSWRSMGCCFEHFMLYQNEVAVARQMELPFPEVSEKINDTIPEEDTVFTPINTDVLKIENKIQIESKPKVSKK